MRKKDECFFVVENPLKILFTICCLLFADLLNGGIGGLLISAFAAVHLLFNDVKAQSLSLFISNERFPLGFRFGISCSLLS